MEHSFNVEIAKLYGIEEAVVLNNLFFWIRKNEANEQHFHDGRYWTFNTNKALSSLFPYISESKMFRVLKHLEEEGIILKGNYNKEKWDRTCWYSLSDKGLLLLNYQFQNEGMHFAEMKNGDLQNEVTIPDNKTTDNKHKEEDKSSKKKEDEEFVDRMYKLYPTHCPKRNHSLGKSRKDKLKIERLLKTYSKEQIEAVIQNEIDTKYGNEWMQNFSTFLNNFPDPDTIMQKEVITEETQNKNLVIGGTEYR